MKIEQMRYLVGDKVEFRFGDRIVEGQVYIADFMGSLENDYHSYDVMVTDGDHKCLYKHLPEADLIKLIEPSEKIPFDGTRVGWRTESGTYHIHTISGSTYLLRIVDRTATLRRTNDERKMRKDGTDLKVLDFYVQQGRSAGFTLEPLGEGSVTTRMTSMVTGIQKE